MNAMHRLLLSIFMILSSLSVLASGPKYRLVWMDHFNRPTIDTCSWSKLGRGTSDWNRHMSDGDSLYAVHDGNLILRGVLNADTRQDTARFVTGGICTQHKRTIGFGKVEVRARLGRAQGAWPAIWMLPDGEVRWPKGGEIDIMEHLNHDSIVYQTVHSHYTLELDKTNTPPHGSTHAIDRDGFNTYAVEVLPDSLIFSVNGDRYFSYPRIQTDKEGQYPFGQPYYLLVDMQLEGSWVGKAAPEQLPVEMEVDWVKFYEMVE